MSTHPSSLLLSSAANARSASASEQPLPPSLSTPSSSSLPLSAVAESLRILLLMQFRIHNGARAVGSDAGPLLAKVHSTMESMQREIASLRLQLQPRASVTPASAAPSLSSDRDRFADPQTSPSSSINLKKRSLDESPSASSLMGAATPSAAAAASLSLSSPLQPESEQPANKKQRHGSKESDELVVSEPVLATSSLGVQGGAFSATQPLPAAAASSSTSASDPAAAVSAAAPAAAFVPISVQLVMQFLSLRGVCACARVCRAWFIAAASPFIWTGRTESLKYDTNEKLTRWMKSRVLHNVRKVELESVVGRQPRQAVISLLDRLALLPQLSELSFSTEGRSAFFLLNHPLTQRLPSIHVVDFAAMTLAKSPMLKSEELMAGLMKCTQLRKLHLKGGQLWPLERMPQLEELAMSHYIPNSPLRINRMPHLRVLHLVLPIERVEQLCELGQSTLVSLCELQLRFEGPRHGAPVTAADETAVATFGLPATSRTLLLCRLSCLGRLLTLQRLTLLHDDRCGSCADPMLPLRLAQQRDARAFQQLREFAFKQEKENPVPPRWYEEVTPLICSCDKEEEAELNPSDQRALLFPRLAAVHIDCCPPNFLNLPQFDQMCRQMPAVRSLKLKMHLLSRRGEPDDDRMATDALACCRLSSMRKLTQLHTLRISHPNWYADHVSTQSLVDLHSLSALPGLAHLEIANVCEFQSRAEVDEIMKMQPVRLPQWQPRRISLQIKSNLSDRS